MVYRWRCPQEDFTGWSPDRKQLIRAIKTHLLGHHNANLSHRSFRFLWECPYCDEVELRHEKTMAIKRFRDHLFSHAESRLQSGVHVADDLDRRGSALILSSSSSAEAANACAHFLSIADTAIFVTTDPLERLSLFGEGGITWPNATVIITSAPDGVDTTSIDPPNNGMLNVIPVDEGFDPSSLGQTLSRTLGDKSSRGQKISMCFDAIPQILDELELQTAFRFLHLLNGHLKEADAIGHYYVDPGRQPEASINILESVFDLTISAQDQVFTSQSIGRSGS